MNGAIHKLEREVGRFLVAAGIPDGAVLVAACSGGADSVALARALGALAPRHGWRIIVAHLDHGLRGRAGADDAVWVARQARAWGFQSTTGRAGLARVPRHGLSVEMVARRARYRFLVRAARACGAHAILTAHTADDQAETVLLKLCRGAGPAGLAGIPPDGRQAGARVLRPLLALTRAEIVAYLTARGQAWREDASNADRRFLRNRVRHELLPALAAALNPRVRQALARAAAVMREEQAWHATLAADACATAARDPERLPASLFCAAPVALRRRLLLTWLRAAGVPSARITAARLQALDALPSGGRLALPGGRAVRREADGALQLMRAPSRTRRLRPRRIAASGMTDLPDWGLRVETRLAAGLTRARAAFGDWPAAATLAPRAAKARLVLRAWRPGDRIRLLGMDGHRKLQDVFTDAKVPRAARARLPVLVCGDEIVWVPGYRVAADWAVTDPRARNLQIRIAARAGEPNGSNKLIMSAK